MHLDGLGAACSDPNAPGRASDQGLTLVHFSAHLEPCLTHNNTLHTPITPRHPLNMGYTTTHSHPLSHTRTPYPKRSS